MTRLALDSWKQISAYLKRNPRTCQRWEREFGLPIHRLDASPKARVYAYTDELDAWLDRKLHETQVAEAAKKRRIRRRWRWGAAGVLAVAAFILALPWLGRLVRLRSVSKPVLAVVSFADQTGDASLGYLCESLPTNLVLDLQRLTDQVSVVSLGRMVDILSGLKLTPNAAFSSQDIQAIAKKARASCVLLGYVFRAGTNTLRVDFEIKESRGLHHVVSDRVTGRLDDVSAVEAALAERVLAAFGLRPEARADINRSCSPQAQKFYLMGQNAQKRYLISMHPDDLDVAVSMFEKARDEDPACAFAYLGLGESYHWRYFFGEQKSEALDLMAANYNKAYDLDPDLAPANSGKGWSYYFRQDRDQACRYFKRASEIEPFSVQVNFDVGCYLLNIGYLGAAVKYLSRAILRGPVSARVYSMRAQCYEWLGEYGAALNDVEKIGELAPQDCPSRCQHARILILMRKFAEADAELAVSEALPAANPDVHLTRALLYAARGEGDKALATLDSTRGESPQRTFAESRIYAILGSPDKAVAAIEKAINGDFDKQLYYPYGYLQLSNAKDYFLNSLRQDPRFLEILARQKRVYEDQRARCGGF
jgi:tetratricopeptide (TPR) repeat protein